jgi:hypothetical protein
MTTENQPFSTLHLDSADVLVRKEMSMFRRALLIALVVSTSAFAALPVTITTSPDTFNSILFYRHPVTGFPCNTPWDPASNEVDKTEHIFLSFASVAVAGKIGLLPEKEAEAELTKTLRWIEKIPTAAGFQFDQIHSGDATAAGADFYPTGDLGFNAACLVVVEEAYPSLKPRIAKLLKAMRWDRMYNPSAGYIAGMVRLRPNDVFVPEGSALMLAMDQRVAEFMSIASGGAPAEMWGRLPRHYLSRYGLKYLKPGEALGYGEMTWALGYFLDERGSDVGMSNATLAWTQMLYARDMDFPVWGWSNCLTPYGYRGFGDPDTNWSVVNPHAIAAAAPYYPNQAAKALRALEELGTRRPLAANGRNIPVGFRGSYDIDSKTPAGGIIPGLDQSIIFLSLANYLHDGVVWKYFERNAAVRRGIASIPEYRNPKKEYLEIYAKRDREGPSLPAPKSAPDPEPIIVAKNAAADGGHPFAQRLDGTDVTYHKAVRFRVRGEPAGDALVTLKIGGEGGYRVLPVGPLWSEIVVPLRSFRGGKDGYNYGETDGAFRWTAMWHDRSRAEEITVTPAAGQRIELREVAFLRLSKYELDTAAAKLDGGVTPILDAAGTFDPFDDPRGWRVMTSGPGTTASLSTAPGEKGGSLACDYAFDERGGWIAMLKPARFDLRDKRAFAFSAKADGGPVTLDVKVADPGGATFMQSLGPQAAGDWRTLEAPVSAFQYGWGGERSDHPADSVQWEFTLVSPGAARGRISFDELKLMSEGPAK